jgi:hypothetical protein
MVWIVWLVLDILRTIWSGIHNKAGGLDGFAGGSGNIASNLDGYAGSDFQGTH